MTKSALAALPDHVLLRSSDSEELRFLAQLAAVSTYPAGAYVFRESQPRRAFGILLRGQIDIVKRLRGRSEVLYTLREGESFGEGSLLDHYPRSTSGRVAEEAEIVGIVRGRLRRILTPEAMTRPRLHHEQVERTDVSPLPGAVP